MRGDKFEMPDLRCDLCGKYKIARDVIRIRTDGVIDIICKRCILKEHLRKLKRVRENTGFKK